jgi:uncharacterized RDD family membrane protein YckC
MGTVGDTLGARIAAFVIDSVLIGVVFGLLGAILAVAGGRAGTLLAVVLAPIGFLYFVYMEGAYGQTLGKMAMNIVVVKQDGSACDYVDSLIRNVLRIVDAFPFLYLLGIVVIAVTDEGQRVGDIAASTVVAKTA